MLEQELSKKFKENLKKHLYIHGNFLVIISLSLSYPYEQMDD